MEKEVVMKMKTVRVGILLSFLTLLYGFTLGGVFGAFESSIKGHLKQEGQSVMDTVYKGETAKLKQVVSKSWVYFKRAHLHANGLGVVSLASILVLMAMPVTTTLKRWLAIALGTGALGYSLFWMLAGLKAPALGGTGAAKEALSWLAKPTAFLCIAGLAAVIVIVVKTLFRKD